MKTKSQSQAHLLAEQVDANERTLFTRHFIDKTKYFALSKRCTGLSVVVQLQAGYARMLRIL